MDKLNKDTNASGAQEQEDNPNQAPIETVKKDPTDS
jgi:hypothetical protein